MPMLECEVFLFSYLRIILFFYKESKLRQYYSLIFKQKHKITNTTFVIDIKKSARIGIRNFIHLSYT